MNAGKRSPLIILLVLVTFFTFTSCVKDHFKFDNLEDMDWNPEIAVPLMKSTLTVPDILDRFNDDSIIVVDAQGLLALLYESEIFSLRADQLINLPNQNQNVPFALSAAQITTIETNGSLTTNQTVTYTFGVGGGEQLETILFKSGTLDFAVSNDITYDGQIQISIPALTIAGVPYSRTINFPQGPAGAATASDALIGRSLDLTKGGTTVNEFDINVTFTFNDNATVATPAQLMNFNIGMNNLNFSNMTGYIGQQSFTTGFDSVRIKLFENTTDGNIFYVDPKFRMYFYNSFGAPMEITLNQFDAYSPTTGNINFNYFPGNTLNINAAPSLGTEELTLFTMDTTNSNIRTIISANPTRILYDVSAMSNPLGNTGSNFVTDSSRIRLYGEIELPFHGTADNFTKMDTAEFDLDKMLSDVESDQDSINTGNDIKVQDVEWVLFRLAINNGFPTEGYSQLYFADSNHVIIDSLMSANQQLFASGILDAGGRVTGKMKTVTDIKVYKSKLDALRTNTKYVILKGKVETTNSGNTIVKIYEDYTLDLQVGLAFKITSRITMN